MLSTNHVVLIQPVNTVIKLSGKGLLLFSITLITTETLDQQAAYVLYLSIKQLSDTGHFKDSMFLSMAAPLPPSPTG